MSARKTAAEQVMVLAFLCGSIGGAAPALAQEQEAPDLAFLEYLGSWDESDEDWVLLNDEDVEPVAAEEDDEDIPAPKGEEVAELDDEN